MEKVKDYKKVRAGRMGAAARWGAPRWLDVRDLDSDSRHLLISLVERLRQFPDPEIRADSFAAADHMATNVLGVPETVTEA